MPTPDLTPCKSSNIAAIGHDGADLYVKFNNGQVWKYEGVSAANHKEMAGCGSVGKYFNQFIKANHKGTKVEPE